MNLLVAMDFSDSGAKITDVAARLAGSLGARLWLLHVAQPDPDFVGYDVGPKSVRDNVAKTFHQEHRMLQEHAQRLRQKGLDTHALLIQGVTVDTIIKESERLDCDMILIGSHGHGALYQVLVGSVSEGVLRNSEIPVLVIPSRHGKALPADET